VQAKGLRLERPAPVVPDAALLFSFPERDREFELLVEFDRTQRPVKNLDKLRRYDGLLVGWWRLHDRLEGFREPPAVVFVCTGEEQALGLLQAAEKEVRGLLVNPGDPADRRQYPGRERLLFAAEQDIHRGSGRAWMLPSQPAGEEGAEVAVREVLLPAT
jgi:hypothetical protein